MASHHKYFFETTQFQNKQILEVWTNTLSIDHLGFLTFFSTFGYLSEGTWIDKLTRQIYYKGLQWPLFHLVHTNSKGV